MYRPASGVHLGVSTDELVEGPPLKNIRRDAGVQQGTNSHSRRGQAACAVVTLVGPNDENREQVWRPRGCYACVVDCGSSDGRSVYAAPGGHAYRQPVLDARAAGSVRTRSAPLKHIFDVDHFKYSRFTMRFDRATAQLDWNEGALDTSSVSATIDAASVDTNVPLLDKAGQRR